MALLLCSPLSALLEKKKLLRRNGEALAISVKIKVNAIELDTINRVQFLITLAASDNIR